MARWVRRRDRAGRVLAVANQKPGVIGRYGITREQADRSAWTVDHQGARLEGAAAINRVLRELGAPWRVAASAYALGPVAALEDAIYRWFAKRRSRFVWLGVTPECEESGSGCQ